MPSIEKQLCEAAAEQLMRLLESDYLSIADSIELKDDEILSLSKLSLNEQRYFINHADELLNVIIEPKGLRRRLHELQAQGEIRDLEDSFLLMGAPHVLMRRLFGMHASEFSGRRQLLSLGRSAMGRPKACSEQAEHTIWHQWQAHHNLEERERFRAVAISAGEDLHTVWNALRKHIDA